MAFMLIRADASAAMGTGHVMRCLAVAEVLRDLGHQCVFVAADSTAAVDVRLDQMGFQRCRSPGPPGGAEDLAATKGLIGSLPAAAVIVDGYHFGAAYRTGVRDTGARVLVFDDLADGGDLCADIVVNAAPQAAGLPYGRIAPGALRLLGPAYAPLRSEVRQAALQPRPPLGERRSILLTFGGSDPARLTGPCVEALAPVLPEGCRVLAAVGGSNPDASAIEAAARRWAGLVEVHRDTPHMGALMLKAGLAVSAGGGTTAELAALGVPMLLVIVADNQAPSAFAAEAAGRCEVVDARGHDAITVIARRTLALWNDPERRRAMADRANAQVDGKGAERIAGALLASL